MILAALLLAAQTPPPAPAPQAAPAPSAEEQRFQACAALIATDADKAIADANDWRIKGGGFAARHCLGLAYAAQTRWAPAAVAFEQAARDAEVLRDRRAANLWVQGGNARLAAGEFQPARSDFDAAIASGTLDGDKAGEAHLDRARAAFALKDAAGARTDLDQAVKLVPADPLAWLLSATLARITGDLKRAKADIAEAVKRSPDDANVALEAGNIAMMSGAPDAARVAWQGAITSQPQSESAKAAAAAIKALDENPPPAAAPKP